jgi:deoxyribodipyrimidine photo-lyase
VTETAITWFRCDLRLADNPAWAAATRAAARVVPLFVLDPRLLNAAGPRRRAVLVANLHALDDTLSALGGRLMVVRGAPEEAIPVVAHTIGARSVHANAHVGPFARRRDETVARNLAVAGRGLERCDGWVVHPPGSVSTAAGSVPRVFTRFWNEWSRRPLPLRAEPGRGTPTADPGEGLPMTIAPPAGSYGERAARERLLRFLAESGAGYATERDRLDRDATSRLSADLKFGTISPAEVVRSAASLGERAAAFVRQMAWRDWYAHLVDENPLLLRQAMDPRREVMWCDDPDGFEAWRAGRTGYPAVDAGMRQLAATGWMHNRARMICASFLVKHLLVDWRAGERHFAHLLIDHDPAQDAGNWQWVAGTGPDAAPFFRIFNPVAQGRRFDPEGTFVRRWVPELRLLSDRWIHAPWEAPPAELAAAGVTLDVDYPRPIVEHAFARHRALAAHARCRERR